MPQGRNRTEGGHDAPPIESLLHRVHAHIKAPSITCLTACWRTDEATQLRFFAASVRYFAAFHAALEAP
jgi:hypothetical protein